ncbi:hypothetical protein BC826DRAFT_1110697 [Russula brevipes]|nr:hypothetical protein BC826DRAFT_1110697 [Russula brevipes]
MAIATDLQDRIVTGLRKAIPHVKISDYFPYQERHGKACFVIERVDADTGIRDHVGLVCPKCQPTVTFNSSLRQRIVEHIGAHILHDTAVGRADEPCSLCLRPAPLCKIILKKTKGRTGNLAIDMKASSCPNVSLGLIIYILPTPALRSSCHPLGQA